MKAATVTGPQTRIKLHPDVLCHCERRVIRSTWDRIAAGIGETCGHPNCVAPCLG